MLNVSRYLTATVQDGTVLVSLKNPESRILVVGSTVKHNGPKLNRLKPVSHLMLYPEPGEKGIIALTLELFQCRDNRGHAIYNNLTVFLEISEIDDAPWIDLDNSWLTTKRIGMMVGADIEVTIRDKVFTTAELSRARKPGDPFPNMNGDLLCRYLFGTVDAASVIHAAVEPMLETSARAHLTSAQNMAQALQNKLIDTMLEKRAAIETRDAALTGYGDLREAIESAKWLYNLLSKVPERFRSRKVLKFLEDFAKTQKLPENTNELPA